MYNTEADTKKIGQTFRQLRKQRKISIKQLSEAIASTSSLEKIETDKTHVSFLTMTYLLHKMNINVEDFIFASNLSSSYSYHDFIKKVDHYYRMNDTRSLAYFLHQMSSHESNDPSTFLKMTIISAYIKDHDPDYAINPALLVATSDFLMTVEYWGKYEIAIFSNCVLILRTELIMTIANELMLSLLNAQSYNTHNEIFDALINSVEILFRRKHPEAAKKIIKNLESLAIPETNLIVRLKIKFFDNLLFLAPKEAKSANNHLIAFLRLLGANMLASSYEVFIETMTS